MPRTWACTGADAAKSVATSKATGSTMVSREIIGSLPMASSHAWNSRIDRPTYRLLLEILSMQCLPTSETAQMSDLRLYRGRSSRELNLPFQNGVYMAKQLFQPSDIAFETVTEG